MPTGDETPQNPSSIEMLLVGGGGAGAGGNNIFYPQRTGRNGGGGGGGGVYSSVAGNPGGGPGGSVAAATPISAGVTYTITIGGSGTASTFAAPTISTITASGGGGGGGSNGPGGSAGTYTGQGAAYSGGSPHNAEPDWHSGGGGGGAGGAGGPGAVHTPAGIAPGGNSIINTIRPSSPTFPQYFGAGAPAASIDNYIGAAPQPNGQAGTYGRGGTGPYPGPTGPGQPGVCVFRYPDTFPTAPTTTGSPELITTDGYHIYTFTVSGTISW